MANIIAAAAQIGRIGQHGINNQRPGHVITADVKCDLVERAEYITARYQAAAAGKFLINYRSVLGQNAASSFKQQVACIIQLKAVHPVERQCDLPRIGAGAEHEVVFKLMFTTIEHLVYLRIDAAEPDSTKR